jgi:polyhydroxybutyrate depolymerase
MMMRVLCRGCLTVLLLLGAMLPGLLPVWGADATSSPSPTVLPAPAPADSIPVQAASLPVRTLSVEGVDYKAIVYRPTSLPADQKVPVILAFHGLRMDGPQMMAYTGLNDLADQVGAMVVYPTSPTGFWHVDSVSDDGAAQDVDYVRALIADLKATQAIDSRRIYATGFSNGGFFTQRLACQVNDQIAAFASVASTMGLPLQDHCLHSNKAPVLMINNGNDRVVLAKGEGRTLGIPLFRVTRIASFPDAGRFWADHNGCHPLPFTSNNGSVDTVPTVFDTRFNGCPVHGAVQQVMVAGSGHVWPGAQAWPSERKTLKSRLTRVILGRPTKALLANQTLWNFFKEHQLPPDAKFASAPFNFSA